jgi:hypothetical protein
MRTPAGANETWRATYTVSTQRFSRRVPDDRRVPIGCPCTDERSGNSWELGGVTNIKRREAL